MLFRNLLSKLGVHPTSSGSRKIKQLVCLLEYGSGESANPSPDRVAAMREFKQKYDLADSKFQDLTNVLSTDYHTLKHLTTGPHHREAEALMERKLREFGVVPQGSIECKQ